MNEEIKGYIKSRSKELSEIADKITSLIVDGELSTSEAISVLEGLKLSIWEGHLIETKHKLTSVIEMPSDT